MRDPIFSSNAKQVPWSDLEPKGSDLKVVDGQPMDREQYDIEGWRLEHTYTPKGTGRVVPVWRATLEGLKRYTELRRTRREERKDAWLAREEEEDSFREYVNALDDAKPQR